MQTMWAERRKSERRSSRGPAKLQFGLGNLPRDCTIIDISEGGIRGVAENIDIPPEFSIIMSGGRPRPCRLAWRLGCEFGAEFTDRTEQRSERVHFKVA